MAASVLLGLVMREQPTVLFTLRTAHLSTHAGQISFPGGKADAKTVQHGLARGEAVEQAKTTDGQAAAVEKQNEATLEIGRAHV